MAGIYLHIPFCKSKCIYCDFYSTANLTAKNRYIQALCKELEQRKDYLGGEKIHTIYFGGGTPSLLTTSDFEKIFFTIGNNYDISECREVTLEANPDDITEEYVKSIKMLPFNRVSMGCQTFDDKTLRFLNRRHNASTAINAVNLLQQNGIDNISIDLIYGYPEETVEQWSRDLEQAISFGVPHISAYHLIYEQGTPMHNMLSKGKIKEIDEEKSLLFFSMLIEKLENAGYEQYEISNFCKYGKYSQHNTSYWRGTKYLGCGAAAHSYDGVSREWNISDTNKYILGIDNGRAFEKEVLTPIDVYNEYIITHLRTKWGICLDAFKQLFGDEKLNLLLGGASKFIADNLLQHKDNNLSLTRKGIFLSDNIMSDLLIV